VTGDSGAGDQEKLAEWIVVWSRVKTKIWKRIKIRMKIKIMKRIRSKMRIKIRTIQDKGTRAD
jgi:hypothetical protein